MYFVLCRKERHALKLRSTGLQWILHTAGKEDQIKGIPFIPALVMKQRRSSRDHHATLPSSSLLTYYYPRYPQIRSCRDLVQIRASMTPFSCCHSFDVTVIKLLFRLHIINYVLTYLFISIVRRGGTPNILDSFNQTFI